MGPSFSLLGFFKKSLIVTGWILLVFVILFSSNYKKNSPHKEKALHIFSWSDLIPIDLVKDFEAETGIKVYLDYYSSNEELLLKLKATKGYGYDIILPSDYAVTALAREGLLKPIDKSKIHFINKIHPLLLHHDFDPENTYSLPLQWDIAGFGINTEVFTKSNEEFSWDYLFNEGFLSYKIAMSNDPIEAFCLASQYLFGKKMALSSKESIQVKDLLIKQKKWIEAYAAPRSDFILASKNASLAYSFCSYILRSKNSFPYMKFVVPKDGTFISIENIAIPSVTQNDKEIYTFLNYLYKAEHMAKSCNEFGLFPATTDCTKDLLYKHEYEEILDQVSKDRYNLNFFRHLMPEEEMRSLWVEIKSTNKKKSSD